MTNKAPETKNLLNPLEMRQRSLPGGRRSAAKWMRFWKWEEKLEPIPGDYLKDLDSLEAKMKTC